jgi:hypothetical protein
MEIAIYFTRITEFRWQGELTELPAALRKGVTRREDGETVLDEDALGEKLDDLAMEKLTKGRAAAEVDDESYELGQIEEV